MIGGVTVSDKIALIIADDATGANASGILLKSHNLRVLNRLAINDEDNESDVDTFSTSSRAIYSNDAYETVMKTLKSLEDNYLVYNKRIDSTLRGNIGSELDAFYDYFNGQRKAIIVASFPDSKRLTNRGMLYVNDSLLESTEIARDPKMPIDTSDVRALFEKTSKLKYKNVYRRNLRKGDTYFKEVIENEFKNNDALILDATSNYEIDFIARNIADLDIDIICVDPGPFTSRYTFYTMMKRARVHRNLFVIGSVVDTTLSQLDFISQSADFKLFHVDAKKLLEEDVTSYIDECAKLINTTTRPNIVFATLDVNNVERIDLEEYASVMNTTMEEISNRINNNLAKIAYKAIMISDTLVKNLFTSGGDISIALLDFTNATALDLMDEILPLCVYSKIIGGQLDGMNLVTKGGAIGTFNTYEIIAEYMEEL